jgi:peptide/nickel transport system permease protein
VFDALLHCVRAAFVEPASDDIRRHRRDQGAGLGSLESNTLGITIYSSNYFAAMLHGLWWWFMPPVIIIVILFVGLFGITVGLDELANPRTRRSV